MRNASGAAAEGPEWLGAQVAAEMARMRHAGFRPDGEDEAMLRASLAGAQRRAELSVVAGDAQVDELALQALRTAEILEGTGLEGYVADPEVTDINVNGPDLVHVSYRDGTRRRVRPLVGSAEELEAMIRLIARRAGTPIEGSPTEVDISLPGGSRMTAALGKVTPWPVLAIRVHHTVDVVRADLVRWGMLTGDLSELLAGLARARRNLVIGGGTGCGKTTMMAAWAREIPTDERIVTVEDTYELGLYLDGIHHNVVPLRTCRANVEGVGEVTMAALTRLALRLDPDRVVVGEVRGGECVSLLDAMSQGNDGSCCTIHASSAMQIFTRLAKYASRAPEAPRREDMMYDIADAVDVVIHIGRRRSDKRRVVRSVREVTGSVESQVPASRELWASTGEGIAARTDVRLSADLEEDLRAAGVDPAVLAPRGR